MESIVFLFLILMVQEPVSSAATIFSLYSQGLRIEIIHITFVLATITDICLGYYIGSKLMKITEQTAIVSFLRKRADSFADMSHVRKYPRLMLFLCGPLTFPVTAFITPFLKFSFIESLVILFLGELLIWYSGVWLLVFGLDTFAGQHIHAILFGVVITLLLLLKIKSILLARRS